MFAVEGSRTTVGITGENAVGTQCPRSVGSDASNSAYHASDLSIKDTSGNGWTATIVFNGRGYVITWTKNGSGLNVTFEFTAIRADACEYQQISSPGSSQDIHYPIAAGFDPSIIFTNYWNAGSDGGCGIAVGRDYGYGPVNTNLKMSARMGDNGMGWADHYAMCYECYCSGTASGYMGGADIGDVGDNEYIWEWYKVGAGLNVTANVWALKFKDCDASYKGVGVPVDEYVLSSLSYSPIWCFRGARWCAMRGTVGQESDEGQMCAFNHSSTTYNGVVDTDVGRQGSSTTAYYETDLTLGSNSVWQEATTHGSPSGSSNPGQNFFAFGANSGLGGVEP